ncbi:MAG: hypothetical protein WCO58_03435 [bacterium]
MKTYYHVIFWISLVMCLLPANTFRAISSLSPIIVLGLQFFWFLGIGGMIAYSILIKEIRLESAFLPLIASIIALNLNYFFGKQDAQFVFQLAYIVFFTMFSVGVVCTGFVLCCKKIFRRLFIEHENR